MQRPTFISPMQDVTRPRAASEEGKVTIQRTGARIDQCSTVAGVQEMAESTCLHSRAAAPKSITKLYMPQPAL